MLENLFSLIRMMGGFNNNPNAYQVEKAIRRIIVHQEVVASDGANCQSDEIPVLTISSSATNRVKQDDEDVDEEPTVGDEDYYNELFNFHNVEITPQLVNDTVDYIGGYISFRFRKSITPNTCASCVKIMTEVGPDENRCPLIEAKTRNDALRTPPGSIRKICHRIEEFIRTNRDQRFHIDFERACISQLLSDPPMLFVDTQHDENHKKKFLKFVAKLYFTVRMHHEENILSTVTKYVRRIHTKVVHFQNQ